MAAPLVVDPPLTPGICLLSRLQMRYPPVAGWKYHSWLLAPAEGGLPDRRRVPLPLRQLMENCLKLAVPGVGLWAVKNVPACRLLFAPVSVACRRWSRWCCRWSRNR